MKGEAVVYEGDTRIASTSKTLSAEEVMLKLIVKRFFVPDQDGGAWLIFDRTTGRGIGLIFGPFKPHPRAERRMRTLGLPVGLGAVSITLAPIVAAFGPEALRWNGTAVVTAGQ